MRAVKLVFAAVLITVTSATGLFAGGGRESEEPTARTITIVDSLGSEKEVALPVDRVVVF
jgi:ABC-type Fe3+-hydroxamate transport system substrate-binding protein